MKDKPHWELCQQASVEQDPEQLMELIREINHLLDDKEELRDYSAPSRKTLGKKLIAAPFPVAETPNSS
jgi:hypothetical protein